MSDLPEPLEDWWSDYARHLNRRNRSPKTARTYRQSYERFWRWAADVGLDPDPAVVTTEIVNEFTDKLAGAGITRTSVSIIFRGLRPFFSWWAKETDSENPFARADVPTVKDDKPPPVISDDDVRKLLATCSGKTFEDRRDNAVIRVLYDTGCRRGELVGLRVQDFDRRQDHLTLRGKTGERRVGLSPSTGEALARYMRERKKHPRAEDDALWLGTQGALRETGFARILVRRCKDAGLARINPHRFRHTFSHRYRADGGSDTNLMYLAGWSSLAMAQRYGRSAAAERAREEHRRLSPGDRL